MKARRLVHDLAALVLMACACKSPGTVDIQVGLPMDCAEPSHVAVYLVRGVLCGDCACGACVDLCDGDACTVGCEGEYCTLSEFEDGVALSPNEAGNYAVIYQFVDISAAGDVTELSTACVDDLQLDKDGTSDEQRELTATCCEAADSD